MYRLAESRDSTPQYTPIYYAFISLIQLIDKMSTPNRRHFAYFLTAFCLSSCRTPLRVAACLSVRLSHLEMIEGRTQFKVGGMSLVACVTCDAIMKLKCQNVVL